MKAKNLLILCVVAAVLVGLAIRTSTSKRRNVKPTSQLDAPLLEALQEPGNIEKIHRLSFQSAASTIIVEQAGDGWVARSKYAYPVDFNKIRSFVDALVKMKTGQALPSSPDQLRDLQLSAPGSGGPGTPSGVLVQLQDKDGKDIVAFIVGKERKKDAPPGMGMPPGLGGYTDGRFLAVDGKAYLVAEPLYDLPEEDANWFKTELVSVTAPEITGISLRNADGKTLALSRPQPDADLTLPDLKKKEEMQSSAVSGLANTLSYLSFTDVLDPEVPDTDLGLDKPVTATFETKSGQTYLLRVGDYPADEETKALRINVSYQAPQKTDDKAEESEEAEGEEDKLAAETKKLNDRIGRWVYVVQGYKVDDLIVDRAKFVKEKDSDQVHGPDDGHGH